MRSQWLGLWGALCYCVGVFADETALRPSASLLFKQPELLKSGECVRYQEGGTGWGGTSPRFFVEGQVRSARIERRTLTTCPAVFGKPMGQLTRNEMNQLAKAYPCLAQGEPDTPADLGMVHLVVTHWETPYERRMGSVGRLWRGHFIDRPLVRGMEIELEADLLESCER